MVLYFLRNVMSTGQAPKQMIDPNTMTDYGKMKQLLQFDKLDGDRKGMIREIAEKGQIVTPLYESFSAFQIPDPDIFPSLLFYYGMLTSRTRVENMLFWAFPTIMSGGSIMAILWRNIKPSVR